MTDRSSTLASFLARPHERIVLDVGCGDGRATARLAATEPDVLVIGVDANLDAAARVIKRSRRSPEKGGLGNLAFVRSSAEALPDELAGKVDEVRIDLPWGSLLEGLLAGSAATGGVGAALARLLAPGGTLRVILNSRALPDGLSSAVAEERLRRSLATAGLSEVDVRATAVRPDTGWGKRLAGGRPLVVIIAEARRAY